MVIAHEMAHMWFGDLVTLRWWDDIWLNESFAEYMGYQTLTEATRFTGTWADFGVARKAWGYDADQRPSTHPVAPDPGAVPDTASALLNFDGISYAKGASALRQLVTWLGEKDFLAGINTHFARHKFANATLADFIDYLASRHRPRRPRLGRRLAAHHRRRHPHPRSPRTSRRHLDPHRRPRGQPPAPHRRRRLRPDPDDARHLVLRERFDTRRPRTGTPPVHLGHRPDLLLLNDRDLTYAKSPPRRRLLRTPPSAALSGLPDPLTRAVVWNAARDMVRDGELPPTAYLDTARAHLPHETDLALVQGVLAFAATHIADRYLTRRRAPRRPGHPHLHSAATCIRRTEDGETPACA